MPQLKNFVPSDYLDAGKIWGITSTPNGLLFLASDKGLLEFDGEKWDLYKGSKGITRSIIAVNDSVLFTGSDLDFGVWNRSSNHRFSYTSLYPFKEVAQSQIEEFWHVATLQDMIVFASQYNIYIYKNQQLTKIKAPESINGFYALHDSIFITTSKNSLYLFQELSFKLLGSLPSNYKFELVGTFKKNQENYFVTRDGGIFSLKEGHLKPVIQKISQDLIEAKVFSFSPIGDAYLAFGTVLKGLIITDLNGNILHWINRNKGMQSNTILSLHYSNAGKLWLGLDYGLSSLFLNNNFTYFYDYQGNFGTGSTACLLNDTYYLGTNQGLYFNDWDALNDKNEKSEFTLIPGSEGQVWSLLSIQNRLFIGHNRGLFELVNHKMKALNTNDGVWTMIPFKDYLLTGNYNGISIFKKQKNTWVFDKKMQLISGSCNQLLIDDDENLWVRIPNFGLLRLKLNSDLSPSHQDIFPDSIFESEIKALAFKQGHILAYCSSGTYTFQKETKTFTWSPEQANRLLPENIIEPISPSIKLSNSYLFHSIYNGFALEYVKDDVDENQISIPPLLRLAEAYNNNSKKTIHNHLEIKHKMNNVRMHFIVPNQENVLYQFKLTPEGKWSSFSKSHQAEFIDLKDGDYTFYVRAKFNQLLSPETKISFTILKPFYKTWVAFLIYFGAALLLGLLVYYFQQQSLKKQKKLLLIQEQESIRKLNAEHQITLQKLEQERIENENNKLHQKLRLKTVELANKAKEIEDKNKLLMAIKSKFEEIQDKPKSPTEKLKEIRRLLDSYMGEDDHQFEVLMNELHQEFFKKLQIKYENLSNNDLRLCAYIKVGMSSKEIADLLNIQPSSSYISRSRLRKKLKLKSDENLFDFLNKI